VEERLCILQVGGVKAFSESAVDVGEHRARFVAATLFREEPGEARGRSQFRYFRTLPAGDFDCRAETSLRRMKPHTHYRALAVVYIALTLAGLLWITYLLNRMTHSPPSPQTLGNPIHDAQPVPAP